MRVKHKEWKNDFCESFFKAGGTAGIQAEVAGVELCRWSNPPQAENPAKQDSFLVYRKYCIRLNEKAVHPIEQKP